MLFEVGRLCVKLAGRDSNKKCVVVEKIDNNHVIIDGETRRRKCNVKHLEPLDKIIKLGAKSSRADIIKIFSDMGIELKDTKAKKATQRPLRQKAKKVSEPKAQKSKKPVKEKVSAPKAAEKVEVADEKPEPVKKVEAEKSDK